VLRDVAPKDVRLEIRQTPLASLHDGLVLAVDSGEAPDLALLDSVWVAEFSRQGFLLPLDPSASSSRRCRVRKRSSVRYSSMLLSWLMNQWPSFSLSRYATSAPRERSASTIRSEPAVWSAVPHWLARQIAGCPPRAATLNLLSEGSEFEVGFLPAILREVVLAGEWMLPRPHLFRTYGVLPIGTHGVPTAEAARAGSWTLFRPLPWRKNDIDSFAAGVDCRSCRRFS
jgi:hypothetical protein